MVHASLALSQNRWPPRFKSEWHAVLLLATDGRRTRLPRTSLHKHVDVADSFVVIASNAPEPNNPAWLLYLRASAKAHVPDKKLRINIEATDVCASKDADLRFL